MHERLRDLKMTTLRCQLPLPTDSQNMIVPISAPDFECVERQVPVEDGADSSDLVSALDFSIIYEWASKESRTTGYSKIYLLAWYLHHYQKHTGVLLNDEGLSGVVSMLVEYPNGTSIVHEICSDKSGSAVTLMRELYDIIRAYEDQLSAAIETQINTQIKGEVMDKGSIWESADNLPAVTTSNSTVVAAPALISLADGTFVTHDWLAARYQFLIKEKERLELEVEALKSYLQVELANKQVVGRHKLLMDALENIAEGRNPGVAFMTILMQEITDRISDSHDSDSLYQKLLGAAAQMEESAKIWTSVGTALKHMVPENHRSANAQVSSSQHFKDLPDFIRACVAHKMKQNSPVHIKVYNKDFNLVSGFTWEPKIEAQTYDADMSRAYILSILNSCRSLSTGLSYNLVALTSAKKDAETIAAHTIWL